MVYGPLNRPSNFKIGCKLSIHVLSILHFTQGLKSEGRMISVALKNVFHSKKFLPRTILQSFSVYQQRWQTDILFLIFKFFERHSLFIRVHPLLNWQHCMKLMQAGRSLQYRVAVIFKMTAVNTATWGVVLRSQQSQWLSGHCKGKVKVGGVYLKKHNVLKHFFSVFEASLAFFIYINLHCFMSRPFYSPLVYISSIQLRLHHSLFRLPYPQLGRVSSNLGYFSFSSGSISSSHPQLGRSLSNSNNISVGCISSNLATVHLNHCRLRLILFRLQLIRY
jgi:hypothetical protein